MTRPLAILLNDAWCKPVRSPGASRGAAGLNAGQAPSRRTTFDVRFAWNSELARLLAAVMFNGHSWRA